MAGVAALGWCAFVLGDAYLTQRLARESIESMPPSAASPPTPSDSHASSNLKSSPNGTPLALLSIPRLDLSAVVLQGADARTLRLGLGHIEQTAWPGETGNVAIAGHRDSFFRPLRNVRVGDDIVLETPGRREHYRVSWFRVVHSNDVGVIAPTGNAALTLVTCYPFWFVGSAPDRFVVRATRVDGPTVSNVAQVDEAPRVQDALRTPPPKMPSLDDDAQVRRAVESFRMTYNARLVRHNEPGVLTFPGCHIAVTERTAAADCRLGPSGPANASERWTFRLHRTGTTWTIVSVTMG